MKDSLKNFIEDSLKKETEGKSLAQQSIENYITEVLDMTIIESKNLGAKDSFEDTIEVIAKSKHLNLKYINQIAHF